MVREPFAHPEYREEIEADAVCAQCGTANPEGTLICKTCGNNLRDQRQMRITADQMLDAEVEGASGFSFLAKALTVLGLLLVLWLGLNVDRISSVLTSTGDLSQEAATNPNPILLWEGSDHEIYDDYYQQLLKRYPSYSDAESARLESGAMTGFSDGLYVLYERRGTTEQFVGAAMVWEENGTWYYTAQVNGGIQIRGKATLTDGVLYSQWDEAGMMYNGAFHALGGRAFLGVDRVITIMGQSDLGVTQYQSAAYRLGSL